MNCRNVLSSLAVLATVFSYSADTTADIGTIEDGSHVVTAVDHTKLENDGSSLELSNNQAILTVRETRMTIPDGFKFGGIVPSNVGEIRVYDSWPNDAMPLNGNYYVWRQDGIDSSFNPADNSGGTIFLATQNQPVDGGTPQGHVPEAILFQGGLAMYMISNWDSDTPTLTRLMADSYYTGGDVTISRSVTKVVATTDQIPSVSEYVPYSSITNVVKDILRQAINTGITVDGTNYVLVVEKAQ